MAYRLEDHLLYGEFTHSGRNSTVVYLVLKGMECPVHCTLLGDPEDGLKFRQFRFAPKGVKISGDEPPEIPELSELADTEEERAKLLKYLQGLRPHQIGATGRMEYAMVKLLPPDFDYEHRENYDKPLEFRWAPMLYLEWFSQNGRVVMEITEAEIKMLEGDPIPPPLDHDTDEDAPNTQSTTFITRNEDGGYDIEKVNHHDEDEFTEEMDELASYLDAETRRVESAIRGEDDSDEVIRELELMDHLMESELGDPVASFLRAKQLPNPEDLDEEGAAAVVKSLAMELALFGIAIHACAHMSMKEIYELLLREMLPNSRQHEELVGTGWVMNFCTSDFCDRCEGEMLKSLPNYKAPEDGESPAP